MKNKFPIYYLKCCKKCKYRDKDKMKSLFDSKFVVGCSDVNALGLITIIPNVFYVVDWCKIKQGIKVKF